MILVKLGLLAIYVAVCAALFRPVLAWLIGTGAPVDDQMDAAFVGFLTVAIAAMWPVIVPLYLLALWLANVVGRNLPTKVDR